MGEKTV